MKTSHLASLWNGGWDELGNGLLILDPVNELSGFYFQVFEGAISAIPLSVDLWVHYLNFASQSTKGQIDGPELMRR